MLFIVFLITSVIVCGKINGCPINERPCITANGTQGYCAPSQYCPYLNRLIGVTTPGDLEFVTQSICGYDVDKSRLFCCDINELRTEQHKDIPKITENLSSSQRISSVSKVQSGSAIQVPVSSSLLPVDNFPPLKPEYCQTPNGDRAQCVSIYQCSRIFSILQNSTDESQRTYLRESKCGFANGIVLVCCGQDVNFRSFDEDEENQNFRYNDLIPRNECGLEASASEKGYQPVRIQSRRGNSNLGFTIDMRVFGGEDADINEFPWLALLEIETVSDGTRRFSCGGSLISSRYVLTAAHCLLNRNQQLVNVRLGEWNHKNQGPTCISTKTGNVCMDAPVNVGFESLHPHPEYRVTNREKYNDIGLIRLERDVSFTKHIRPICLPDSNDYLAPGERLTISGWGLKNFNEETSIKQKVDVPIISRSQCSIMFEKNARLNKLGRGQFCAGGEAGKDSCVGDSGAPLMKRFNSTLDGPARWSLEGVVSFGQGCGVQNLYGVYTKVSKYLAWIHKTIVR